MIFIGDFGDFPIEQLLGESFVDFPASFGYHVAQLLDQSSDPGLRTVLIIQHARVAGALHPNSKTIPIPQDGQEAPGMSSAMTKTYQYYYYYHY